MSDKELAVQLASGYLNSFYASGDKKALDPETAKRSCRCFMMPLLPYLTMSNATLPTEICQRPYLP